LEMRIAMKNALIGNVVFPAVIAAIPITTLTSQRRPNQHFSNFL